MHRIFAGGLPTVYFSDYSQKLLPVLNAVKSDIDALIAASAGQVTEEEDNSGSKKRKIILLLFFLTYSI